MITLRKTEADVLELLRAGKDQPTIASQLRISRGTVVSLVARLSELSVIRSTGHGRYEILIDNYECTDRQHGGMSRTKPMTVDIPEGFDTYIRGHYRRIPRSKLAQRLGIDKVTLNLMILQLGLGE